MELESALKTAMELTWLTKTPLKIKIFGWRMLLVRLLTHSNLAIRGVLTNIHEKVYVFCFNNDEVNNHVFISFPRIKLVWKKIVKWVGLPWMIEENCCDHLMA